MEHPIKRLLLLLTGVSQCWKDINFLILAMMFRYYLCTFANRSNLFIHRHQIVKPDTDISYWCWCSDISDMISSSINRIECGRWPMASIENQQFSFIAIQFQLVYHHQCSISLIVQVKIWNAGSTPVSNSTHPFNANQLDFTKWSWNLENGFNSQ